LQAFFLDHVGRSLRRRQLETRTALQGIAVAQGFTFDGKAESGVLGVEPGVFLLRYASSRDAHRAPEIVVSASDDAAIAFLTAEPSGDLVLGAPGHAVPVHVRQAGALHLRLLSLGSAGHASVVLDRLVQGRRSDDSANALLEAASDYATIGMLAHVSRRGDVTAEGGRWMCGPDLPMAIEGLELRLSRSVPGLDIVSSASVNSRGRRTFAPVSLGGFVGTRGKAMPLVGVSFALAGPEADQYSLRCEALFLGAAIVVRSGPRVELMGPTGQEPLVGLRISLEYRPETGDLDLPALPLRAAETAVIAPEQRPAVAAGHVRVFRASRAKVSMPASSTNDHSTHSGA
jgi:hypothetical protein